MAEQETLGNYHASETLKILAKKKKRKKAKTCRINLITTLGKYPV